MKYFILSLLLFSSGLVYAQATYTKASVTTNNLQVLTGYINVRDWDKSPRYIEFKTNLSDKEPQKFDAKAISAFAINDGERYCSYTGPVSLNKVHFPDIDFKQDTSTRQVTAFFKVITTGRFITLYSYTDSLKTRYFIQENKDRPFELTYQQYYDEGGTKALESKRYLTQLNYLAGKYAAGNSRVLNQLDKTNYTGADIDIVVNEINAESPGKAIKHNVIYANYFVGAAANLSRTGFDGYSSFTNYGYVTNYSPRISAGINVFTNKNTPRLMFMFEVSFSYINPTFTGTVYSTASGQFAEYYSFKQYNTSVIPQIIYNIYSSPNFKFYVGAGISFNFSSYPTNTYNVRGIFNKDLDPYILNPTWDSFPFQAGIVLNKHFNIFASYSTSTPIFTDDIGFSINTTTYTGGIRFLFGGGK